MHFRRCFGYAVCPVLAAFLFAPSGLRAQDSSSQQQPAAQQTTQQTPPPNMQETPSKNEQQQRALVLREAQARVNARRQERIRQIIKDTYSHKYEVYFGGGYLRFTPGASLQRMNEKGWNVGMVDYLHGKLGVAADFRGYYGTAFTGLHVNGVNEAYSPSISQYTFLAGPQYRFFEGQHWGWTAQVLAGAGHGNFATGTGGLGSTPVGLWNDGTVLNVSAGASVDYNLGPALALRLTPNALFTNYGSTFQRNLGFNVGVLYRFGHQH
jgi:hypothetical protein